MRIIRAHVQDRIEDRLSCANAVRFESWRGVYVITLYYALALGKTRHWKYNWQFCIWALKIESDGYKFGPLSSFSGTDFVGPGCPCTSSTDGLGWGSVRCLYSPIEFCLAFVDGFLNFSRWVGCCTKTIICIRVALKIKFFILA